MPTNFNWVCFECRSVVRRPSDSTAGPNCPACGEACFNLRHRVAVPKKHELRAWRKLHADCRRRTIAQKDKLAVRRVRLRHTAEKYLAELKALTFNKSRQKEIVEIESCLDDPNKLWRLLPSRLLDLNHAW